MNHTLCSAVLASLVEIILVHPIDVFKILYQQNPKYTFKKYRTTSLQFKYRGFISRTFGIVPMRTSFWVSQDISKKYFPKYKNKYLNYSIMGSFTSLCQTIIDSPIENIKINTINKVPSLLNKQLLLRGFYPNYLRNYIFATSVVSSNEICNDYKVNKFISGSLGGLFGSIISQPIDYIKTLHQSNKPIQFKDLIFDSYHRNHCMTGWLPRASICFISMGIGSFTFHFFK